MLDLTDVIGTSTNRASRTYLMSNNDFKFSENLNEEFTDYSSIQPIILNEFQPLHQIKNIEIAQKTVAAIDNLLGGKLTAFADLFSTPVGEMAMDFRAQEALNTMITNFAVHPEKLFGFQKERR